MSTEIHEWGAADAAALIRIPGPQDNKYSHGVLGVLTGSEKYPGAAVLGVEAAQRTGIGMVRYLGKKTPAHLVLERRPETVTVSGAVDAWLLGSGWEPTTTISPDFPDLARACQGLQPVVIDAGGLGLLPLVSAPAIITPHVGELERLVPRDGRSHSDWAASAADQLEVVVVLKGHETIVASPENQTGDRVLVRVTAPTTWLATAGTGDVLAGVIAALVAAHSHGHVPHPAELAHIAATGVYLHGAAAALAAEDGPFPALDVAEQVGLAVSELFTGEAG